MIIEKDGKIIVTELRPMSDLNAGQAGVCYFKDMTFDVLKRSKERSDYLTDPGVPVIYYHEKRFVGFLPLPIYQPQQKQEPVYLECGE